MISFFRVLFSPDDVEFFKILWWRFSSSQVLRETPGAALHTENRQRRRGPAKGQVLLTTQWFIMRIWTTFYGSKWKWISESEWPTKRVTLIGTIDLTWKKTNKQKKQMNHFFGKFLSPLLCWQGAHHFVSIPWYFQIQSCMHFSTGQLLKQIKKVTWNLYCFGERMNDKNNENRTHPGKWYRRARIWKILTLNTF